MVTALVATGWASVMLGEHADRDQITGLAHLRTPTLVVVDYAEGRAAQLEAVLDALGDADTTTRLLLLARTAGDWRTDRVGTAPILEALADHRIVLPLHPLEPEIDGRQAAWRDAVEALTRTLPTVQPADWVGHAAKLSAPPLDGDRYRTILAVQMDALARLLEAAEPLSAPGMTSEDVVLLHERRYWTRIAEQFRVSLDPATLEALILTATLWGATDGKKPTRSSRRSRKTPTTTYASELTRGCTHFTAMRNAIGWVCSPIGSPNTSSAQPPARRLAISI